MNEIFDVLTTNHEVLKCYPELVINLLNGTYIIKRTNVVSLEIYDVVTQYETEIFPGDTVMYHITYRSGWWKSGLSLVPSYYNKRLQQFSTIEIEI